MSNLEKVVTSLRIDGVYKVNNCLDSEHLIKVREKLCDIYDKGKPSNIVTPVNVAGLNSDELRSYGAKRAELSKVNPNFYLKESDILKGMQHYGKLTTAASLKNPLVEIPELCEIAMNEYLLDVASRYLGERAKVTYIKVRRFFVNDLPNFDTNYFHTDDNQKDPEGLLKAIIPLTNTNESSGGIFEYMKGSHKNSIPKNSIFDYSLEEKDVFEFYDKALHFKESSNVGDVLFANTLGVHRGTKPEASDRLVLFVNYGKIPEYGKKSSGVSIHTRTYETLTKKQKKAAQYLEIIK